MAKKRVTHENKLNLPQYLIELEIFSRLPVKSLIRFKSLSKQWYFVISSAHFARFHFKQYGHNYTQKNLLIDTRGSIHILDWASFDESNQKSLRLFEGPVKTDFDPKSVQFVGSCQGLICSYHGMDYYFVWNPSTNNSRKISGYSPNRQKNITNVDSIAVIIRGFGYVSSIDDYNIVQIEVIKSIIGTKTVNISVFTLKGGCWEDTATDDYSLTFWHKLCVRPGTALVNETLRWLVDTFGDTVVLGVDLANRKMLHPVPLPDILSHREMFLSVLEQHVCVRNKNGSFIEIWILRDLNWQKHFKFDLGVSFIGGLKFTEWNLFGCSETESLKIVVRPCDGRAPLVVDLSRYQPKQVSLPRQIYLSFAVSYVESLVSP